VSGIDEAPLAVIRSQPHVICSPPMRARIRRALGWLIAPAVAVSCSLSSLDDLKQNADAGGTGGSAGSCQQGVDCNGCPDCAYWCACVASSNVVQCWFGWRRGGRGWGLRRHGGLRRRRRRRCMPGSRCVDVQPMLRGCQPDRARAILRGRGQVLLLEQRAVRRGVQRVLQWAAARAELYDLRQFGHRAGLRAAVLPGALPSFSRMFLSMPAPLIATENR
jgi:hypothetical protein